MVGTMSRHPWRAAARPMLYAARGEGAFIVAGSLSRPSAGELVGGLEDQQRIFLTRWDDLVAGGVTEPEKFDAVTDLGPSVYIDTVTTKAGNNITVGGVDATQPVSELPIGAGSRWVSSASDTGISYAGTVTGFIAGRIYLSATPGLITEQKIVFYSLSEARELSCHNFQTVYERGRATWVRAEVTG